MARRRKYTDKQMIKALTDTFGLISKAARVIGCSPQTIYDRAAVEPAVAAAIKEPRAELVDEAELGLREAISKGEAWAIALTLKTLGKDRGYIERVETQAMDDRKIEVTVTHETKPYPTDAAPSTSQGSSGE